MNHNIPFSNDKLVIDDTVVFSVFRSFIPLYLNKYVSLHYKCNISLSKLEGRFGADNSCEMSHILCCLVIGSHGTAGPPGSSRAKR